jgi:hypothetical protein
LSADGIPDRFPWRPTGHSGIVPSRGFRREENGMTALSSVLLVLTMGLGVALFAALRA